MKMTQITEPLVGYTDKYDAWRGLCFWTARVWIPFFVIQFFHPPHLLGRTLTFSSDIASRWKAQLLFFIYFFCQNHAYFPAQNMSGIVMNVYQWGSINDALLSVRLWPVPSPRVLLVGIFCVGIFGMMRMIYDFWEHFFLEILWLFFFSKVRECRPKHHRNRGDSY